MKRFCILLILTLFLGCQEKLTKEQWQLKYPADINAVKAHLAQEAGEAKIKDQSKLASIERFLIVACVVCLVGAIILIPLKLQSFIFIPVSILLGNGAGISFLEMNSHYPQIVPIAGGVMVLLLAGIAVIYYVKHSNLKDLLNESQGTTANTV
jgi:hypothetical protein